MININNILTQLNAKMAADIADSYNIPELVKRVEAYQKLNIDAGTVPEYHSAQELPDSDSANIGQIVYVKQKPASRGDYANNVKDSAGTFFYGVKITANNPAQLLPIGSSILGWQKIPMLAGDSDYDDISIPVYSFQGSISGYNAGGNSPPSSPPAIVNTIEKYSFTSDANSTDVGDLNNIVQGATGQSSATHGYSSGGTSSPGPTQYLNTIEKYSFTSDGNGSDVGDLTTANRLNTAAGASSSASGYNAGGTVQVPSPYGPNTLTSYSNVIDKFPFASDANATDVGDLTEAKYALAGHSSSTHGYRSGGTVPAVNTIDKFSFSVDGNATDVGDLLFVVNQHVGQSSTTHGYVSGGTPPGTRNDIQKFPFVADGNATDVGDTTTAYRRGSGTSSTASGYNAGGRRPSVANTIDKFPFASDANATDVADLLAIYEVGSGTQV